MIGKVQVVRPYSNILSRIINWAATWLRLVSCFVFFFFLLRNYTFCGGGWMQRNSRFWGVLVGLESSRCGKSLISARYWGHCLVVFVEYLVILFWFEKLRLWPWEFCAKRPREGGRVFRLFNLEIKLCIVVFSFLFIITIIVIVFIIIFDVISITNVFKLLSSLLLPLLLIL